MTIIPEQYVAQQKIVIAKAFVVLVLVQSLMGILLPPCGQKAGKKQLWLVRTAFVATCLGYRRVPTKLFQFQCPQGRSNLSHNNMSSGKGDSSHRDNNLRQDLERVSLTHKNAEAFQKYPTVLSFTPSTEMTHFPERRDRKPCQYTISQHLKTVL